MTSAAEPADVAELLRVCAHALHAGKGIARLSAGLAIIAALGVMVAGMLASITAVLLWSMALGAGLVAQWMAFRLRFDAALFAELARDATSAEPDIARLDRALLALQLMPGGKAGRAVDARCRGALRLLRILGLLVFAQALLTVIAGASLQGG